MRSTISIQNLCSRCKINYCLEQVAACIASPQMPDAALAHMLRPCRSYDSLAALCASRQFADGTGFGMGIGIEHVILPVRSLLCGGFVNMS